MSWPRSTHFGTGRDARVYGRKGGSTMRYRMPPEEWAAYQRQWIAAKRRRQMAAKKAS